MTPREVDALSLRDAVLMCKAAEERERSAWARTLRVTQSWGDKLTVDEMFGDTRGGLTASRRERLRAVTQEHYRIRRERGLA